MSRDYRVTLTYPVTEEVDGLGTVNTTRTEQWFFESPHEAWEQYKAAVGRLMHLGAFAQVDLIKHGVVTNTQANVPPPLDHPLVDELLAKLRQKGQRP